MQMQNSLQLKLDQINVDYFQLKTKAQSLSHGRLLYEYNQEEAQHYWIKTQLSQGHSQYELGFRRELDFYSAVNEDDLAKIVLKHTILQLMSSNPYIRLGNFSLILPHSSLFFDQVPQNLPHDELVHKILLILSAVEILHQHGWVHGDLKQEHFCQFNGQLKIIDFEQCLKVQDMKQQLLNATPRYMAPELFNGEAKSYASDIYALGIILLEWLMQSRLTAKNYQEWAILHCQNLKIQLPKLFKSFEPLLNMMLEKQKTKRTMNFSTLKTRLIIDNV